MKIGPGVSELWGVENRPLPLTRPMAYTTACSTVQAVMVWYLSMPDQSATDGLQKIIKIDNMVWWFADAIQQLHNNTSFLPRAKLLMRKELQEIWNCCDGQWHSQEIFLGEQKLEGVWARKPPSGVQGRSPVGGSPRSWRLNHKKPSNLSSREHHCAYCCSKPWGLSISSLHLSPTLLELGSLNFSPLDRYLSVSELIV